MNLEYITKAHYYVKLGRIASLNEVIDDYKKKYPEWNLDKYNLTFKVLFFNACNHDQYDIALYLYNTMYSFLKETDKILLKTTFKLCYNRALARKDNVNELNKKNNQKLIKWLNTLI